MPIAALSDISHSQAFRLIEVSAGSPTFLGNLRCNQIYNAYRISEASGYLV